MSADWIELELREDRDDFEDVVAVYSHHDPSVPHVYEATEPPGRLGLMIVAPDEERRNRVLLPMFPADMDQDDCVEWAMELAENYGAAVGLR